MGINFVCNHIIECDEPGCNEWICCSNMATSDFIEYVKKYYGWDIKPNNPFMFCPKHSRDKNSSYNEKKESEYKPEES